MKSIAVFAAACGIFLSQASLLAAPPEAFFKVHCFECHDADTKQAELDLTALPSDLNNAETFAKWVKIHDLIELGEMPPKEQPRPSDADKTDALKSLKTSLVTAEQDKLKSQPRTGIRRLTRAEYENTIRDLFDMPGIVLQNELPPDGSAHGFDKNSDALDISHVNLAKYMEAADRILTLAIAVQPAQPAIKKQRISLAYPAGFVAHVLMNGDGILIKNKQVDPDFPAAGEQNHLDQGAQ